MMHRNFILLFASALIAVATGCKKSDPAQDPAQDANSVTDCQGNTYKTVTIGKQVWMAENLRCTKYDTDSERPGETLPQDYKEATITPFCVNASNKGAWFEGSGEDDPSNSKYTGRKLSDEQVAKLGILYNWAAAVGLKDKDDIYDQTKEFSKQRQGICPNGWHIPTAAEYAELAKELGGDPEKSSEGVIHYAAVGKFLKSASGWFEDGNGSDTFGFNALPAGQNAEPPMVYFIGTVINLCTATPDGKNYCFSYEIHYSSNQFTQYSEGNAFKEMAYSVRCVKN